LRFEGATLQLVDAVLDPVVNTGGEGGAELRYENKEAENESIANCDDGGEYNDESEVDDVDVAAAC
jgi:hypothetical protein